MSAIPLINSKVDYSVLKQISTSNFTVYLAKNPQNNLPYAMKVFPYKDNEPHSGFIRELPATNFNHKNVIQIVDYTSKIKTETGDKYSGFSSFIVMELAPYGDLAEFLMKTDFYRDDKFVRTVFRHVCEGVKYIHSKKFAHMDLKLENILLGENFVPKVSDFDSLKDLSNFKPCDKIQRLGTVNSRAPELANRTCKDAYKADMYSLGIILLTLQFGLLPYMEQSEFEGHNLEKMLQESDPEYFEVHIGKSSLPCDKLEPFKELVFGMTKKNPSKRMSFEEMEKTRGMLERFTLRENSKKL